MSMKTVFLWECFLEFFL